MPIGVGQHLADPGCHVRRRRFRIVEYEGHLDIHTHVAGGHRATLGMMDVRRVIRGDHLLVDHGDDGASRLYEAAHQAIEHAGGASVRFALMGASDHDHELAVGEFDRVAGGYGAATVDIEHFGSSLSPSADCSLNALSHR